MISQANLTKKSVHFDIPFLPRHQTKSIKKPKIQFLVSLSTITPGHVNFTPINMNSFGLIRYIRQGQYRDYRMETGNGILLAFIKFRELNETNFPRFHVTLPTVGVLAWTEAQVELDLDSHLYPRMLVYYENDYGESISYYYRWVSTENTSKITSNLVLYNLYEYSRPIGLYCPPKDNNRQGSLEFFSKNGQPLLKEDILLFIMLLSVSLSFNPVYRPLRRCESLNLMTTQLVPEPPAPISLPAKLVSNPIKPPCFKW